MSKKGTVTFILIICVVSTIVLLLIYIRPISVDIKLNGVRYSTVLNDDSIIQTEIVVMQGTLKRKLNGERTFSGTLGSGKNELELQKNMRKVDILFDSEGYGKMMSTQVNQQADWKPENYRYGIIFADFNRKELTIQLNELNEKSVERWVQGEGNLITAPASNKADALKISNRLMENFVNLEKKQ